MAENKKARKEAAIKKAKLRKRIIIATCIGFAAIIIMLVILNSLSSFRPQNENTPANFDADMVIDIDLTVLGENMIRAEVVNILSSPEEYLGKVIKMSGPYYAVPEPMLGRVIDMIAVAEVDACCPPLGFEIIVGDFFDLRPFDFPNQGTRIEVTGVFSTYEEKGIDLYYLAVNDVFILS